MKVAILSIGDYRHISMISKYTDYFDKVNVNYDVICTDRYNEVIDNSHLIRFPFHHANGKIKKVRAFIRFEKWARRIIKKEKYDFIVVWNENTALLFARLLLSRYKNRYCVNIRDVDFMNQSLLNIIRKRVILHSNFSTYCSPAKLDFPKNYEYILMRSVNMQILRNMQKRSCFRKPNEKIRIVSLGKIRFPKANRDILNIFGNDSRFELHFIGAGSESLQYAVEQYSNVFIKGKYLPEETPEFLEQTDVINSYFCNVLGYEKMSSIRFSYGPYLHIPVLVCDKTMMQEEGDQYGFTFAIDPKRTDGIADQFYDWYMSRDVTCFYEGCDRYCRDIKLSDEKFYKKMDQLFISNHSR